MKQSAVIFLAFALAACAGTSSSVRAPETAPSDTAPDAAPAPPPEPTVPELIAQAAQIHQPQAARELLLRALAQEPDNPEAHLQLARMDTDSGNGEAAFVHLAAVLSAQPTHREALQLAAELTASLPNRLPQTIDLVRRALETSPDDAQWLVLLADLHRKSGNSAEARVVLNQLLAVHPDDGQACVLLAFISLAEGRFREAEFHARRALTRLPENAAAHHALGLAMAARSSGSDDSEAIRSLSQSVQLNAQNPAAWVDLGRVLLRNRDCSGAEKAFRHAQALMPDTPAILLGLAAAVEGQKDSAGKPRFDEAEKLYRQVMAAMPENPEAAAALADLKAGPMKDFREAEALYVRAIELLPEGTRRTQAEKSLETVRQRLAAEAELSAASVPDAAAP